ncbi:stationary phase inducible protein CsiE [Sodalis ligni]|uniref:BglG family transcriptional antiterminator n=1 Tax=Sodalis ligni TaxID=2697027 RepID=A0A4R1NIN2_9GAMM|nr:stationary phase inducible protein CsiE [Sodalis ligni]TCL06939.1 BglG family transcriptional antiterminator [Sodalis ligni]
MSLPTPPVPALSGSQRRSHLLLMLFAPLPSLSLVSLSRYNGEDLPTTRRDLVHIESEMRRIYHLSLVVGHDGNYRIEGNVLNKRLCLIEGMRRTLRLCPDKVNRYFLPLQQHQWLHLPADYQITDEQFEAAITGYTSLLERPPSASDVAFLHLYLRYVLMQCHAREQPEFNQHQLQWLQQKAEYQQVLDIFRLWPLPENELIGFTLLARLLKTPNQTGVRSDDDRQLLQEVKNIIRRFEQVAQTTFHQPEMLAGQLFSHLSAALERCHFRVGIDNSLQLEVEEKYPRLLRTTRAAVMPLEAAYRIRFPREELGLIAVIFGAWLMQDNDLQEKQVVILTNSEGGKEKTLELQIRELTLLPLNIKFQSLAEFQVRGAPKNTVLVISPFSLPLPLFSPPLMLVRLPLAQSQQERIRQLLEA